MGRWLTITGFAAVIACLAGCGGPQGDAVDSSRSSSATPPPKAEKGVVFMDGRVDSGDLKKPAGDGVLLGPHFAVTIAATGSADTYDFGPSASSAGGTTERRPADGEEFLVVEFDLTAESPDEDPIDLKSTTVEAPAEVTTELSIDGERTEVDLAQNLPVLVAGVPTGADVLLEVSDDGDVQSIDLRTGERGDDARTPFYRPTSEQSLDHTYRHDASFAFPEGGGGTYSVQLHLDFAYLTPYTDDIGWAPSGESWLIVTMDTSDYDMQADQSKYAAMFLPDLPASLTLGAPDGTIYPLSSRAEELNSSALVDGQVWLWQVPQDFTTAAMTILPTGDLLGDLLENPTWQVPLPSEVVQVAIPD